MASRELLPGGRPQSGATGHALAIGAVFETAQGVLHFYQRPRRQSVFFERFRCALEGGGVARRIPDFSFTRNAPFYFEARDNRKKIASFVVQPLFEVFDICCR